MENRSSCTRCESCLAVSDERTQMAAVLHDVLEDTSVTVDELRGEELPADVVDAVLALTHRAGTSYEEYIEEVALNSIARDVKVVDIKDNLVNNRRLPATPDVIARIVRYERALLRLRE